MTDAAPAAVSIIMPMYNVERYIGESVASLKGQTFEDIQVVIVDDGSTDGSYDAAVEAIGDDARFLLVRQENAGPATARNRGIAESVGEYLMFMDADDMLEQHAVDMLYTKAEGDQLDYLDFSAHTVYEDEKLRAIRNESFYEGRSDIEGVMTGPELFVCFQKNREYVCSLCLHFFKRSLLNDSGLSLRDGMYVHEDELFSPLLIAYAKRAAFLNEPLYIRRVRARSATTTGRSPRNVKSMFEAARGLRSWLGERESSLDSLFVAALSARIAELYELAAMDAALIESYDLVAIAETYTGLDRVDFEIEVVQRMITRDEFYRSRTYRAGEILLAAPKKVRDTIRRMNER
ncbi:MAG: glycosyltransferase [Eggerthellaceae bacterium]|nr:glycosyltransferase [Eggerthellaceae bacterium]